MNINFKSPLRLLIIAIIAIVLTLSQVLTSEAEAVFQEGGDRSRPAAPSNTNSNSNISISDWTPWILGGGTVVIVAAGAAWYTKKAKKK